MFNFNQALLTRCLQRFKNVCSAKYTIAHLKHRSLLHVYGKDSSKLLQGLITNDINLLSQESKYLLYCMFLNARGRCEYDVMLYPYMENNTDGFLIECDTTQSENLLKFMKMYKLRSKVKFSIFEEKKVFSIFGSDISNKIENFKTEEILLFNDNRMKDFNYRLVSNKPIDDLASALCCEKSSIDEYQIYRYKHGISEGESETLNCIPLEHNLAFLNGISFTKGCYIGQELMAKTNFTGVIRKRIAPFYLHTCDHGLKVGSTIQNNKNKRVGKIVGIKNQYGIALVRLNDFFTGSDFMAHDENGERCPITIEKPSFWPDDIQY